MKKAYFFLSLLFPFLFLEKITAQWSVTPSIGVNNAILVFDKSPHLTSKYREDPFRNINLGFAGVSTKYNFNKRIAAELGVQFSQKGYAFQNLIPYISRVKVTYFDVMPIVEISPFSFLSFFTGVNIGIKQGTYFAFDNRVWKIPIVSMSDFKNTDFGGLIGFRLKYKKIQLGFHANRSFLPVTTFDFSDDNGYLVKDLKQYHKVFQLSLGYTINWKDI